MSRLAEIGVIGLGVMGRNLALNFAEHGRRVAVFDPFPEAVAAFDPEGADIRVCDDLPALVEALSAPRAVLLMVKAGEPVDRQIDALAPVLQPGDVIVEGGNSHFRDTERRQERLQANGVHLLGVGISGGGNGARHGPSMMAGGTPAAFDRVAGLLGDIAAKAGEAGDETCCAYFGPGGAGHFVKMLHNGIEYAIMQSIADAYLLMRDLLGLDHAEMASVFSRWNDGPLNGFLIEATADILGRTDPETGRPLPMVVLDKAGQKGTGQWSALAALELGVPAPTLLEAVSARGLSGLKTEREMAARAFGGNIPAFDGDKAAFVDALEHSLLASAFCTHAQGFAVMAAASDAYGWSLNLDAVAAVWRNGCILRARLLDDVRRAYERDGSLANLLLDGGIADMVGPAVHGWRHAVSSAVRSGLPVPALSSALSYHDGFRLDPSPASLIQAQRDFFGAHGFERVDKPGIFHADWSKP